MLWVLIGVRGDLSSPLFELKVPVRQNYSFAYIFADGKS